MKYYIQQLLLAVLILTSCGGKITPASTSDNLYEAWRVEYESITVVPPGYTVRIIHPDLLPNHPLIMKLPSYQKIISSKDRSIDILILKKLKPFALNDVSSIKPGDEFLGFAYCARNNLDAEAITKESGLGLDYNQLALMLCKKFDATFIRK